MTNSSFQLFNLNTMSGVFPGTRTMIFQRARVRAQTTPESQTTPETPATSVRLLWYDDPAACVVEQDGAPLLRIPTPHTGDFGARLQEGLAAAGYELLTCGSCAFWQPWAAATADGLALGGCTWRDEGESDSGESAPPALAAQSLLALDCPHWQVAQGQARPVSTAPSGFAPPGSDPGEAATLPPIPKRAERESDERWSWWGRLRRSWRGRQAWRERQVGDDSPAAQRDANTIVERSGVGAGTEPCFACQGRIANLGALAVAAPEGDKQTYSVWRCRLCCTYYLNDWIDRWERTDSLETEETYYRLAPHEALAILAAIDNVVDADHPARRHERGAQRAWVEQFLAGRPALSHQIKQGR